MIPVNRLNPFRRFCMTIGELPTSYIESMTYAELVTWLCNYLENTVIPTVNNNGQAVTELQELFKQLETFVTTYLDSPEFIADVDAKLDEMASDGTLDQLINTNITGSLSNLNTTDKTSLVNAINEVNNNIGDLSELETTVKTDVVSSINDLYNNNGVITPTLNLTGCTQTVSSNLKFPLPVVNSYYNDKMYSKIPNTWIFSPDLNYTLDGATVEIIVDGVDVTSQSAHYIESTGRIRLDVVCPVNSVIINITAVSTQE